MLRTRRSISIVDRLKQLIFPIYCVGCHEESDWICPKCLKSLSIFGDRRCVICKKAGINGLCVKCHRETLLDGVIAPLDYQQLFVKELVSGAKYNTNWDSLLCLCTAVQDLITRRLPDEDWSYTFIPQTKLRATERGYNQSEIIASFFSPAPLFVGVKKVKETRSQATLTKNLRKENLRNAFKVMDSVPENIVLCDDVITTGNTLSAVAKALKRSGAKQIWAIALAHD